MRRILVTVVAVVLFLGLAGALVVYAEPARQSPSPVTLGDAGWNDPTVGTWDPTTRVATLTADLSRPLQIITNTLTLDGGGHTLTGSGTGYGVYLTSRSVVTISNLTVKGFARGFYLYRSSAVTLAANTATGNDYGIYLSYSNRNTLSGNTANANRYQGIHVDNGGTNQLTNNTASSNSQDGMQFLNSNRNTLTGNTANANRDYGLRLERGGENVLSANSMAQNRFNFRLYGETDYEYGHTIDTSNLVDGKPIYYLKGASGQAIDGSSNAGTVILANCSDMAVQGLTLSNNDNGILLWGTQNSRIANVQANNNSTGIKLWNSNGNTLSGNSASSNAYHGIWLASSGSNTLTGNTASLNSSYYAIFLQAASGNTLTGNAISDNAYGLYLDGANDNRIYNNRLISNGTQAYVTAGTGNLFSLPAPTGGNYWSNWTTPDANGDGFVDSPYVFTGGQDDLPWAKDGGWTDRVPPTTTIDLAGTPGSEGWYRSDVQVTLTAVDNPGGTGVERTQYSFDGLTWNTYFGPFNIASEGPTTVFYRSIDKAGNVEQPGEESVLLSDEFTALDPAAWVNAPYLPGYSGRPQTLSPTTVDGKSALYMQTDEAPPDKRRGIASAAAVTVAPEMVVEAAFKPVGDIDGVAELWLVDPASGKFVRISAINGNYGQGRSVTAEVSGQGQRNSPDPVFDLNQWSFFRIETSAGRTVISLLDSARNVKWSTTYDVALSALFGDFHVALSQMLGDPYAGGWHMRAYFDYVKVSKINRVAKSETLKIDKTPPVITQGAVEGTPGLDGWYTSDVTVPVTAADGVSGLADPAAAAFALVARGEGAAVSTGAQEVYDRAGNRAVAGPLTFKIDWTPPTLEGRPTASPNANGWYSGNVTIRWVAEDGVSGVDPAAVPADSVIEGEGTGLGAGPVTVADRAGNSATASVSGINIDRTPPTLAFGQLAPANAAGWYTADVSIPFTAGDSLSGLDPASPSGPLVLSEEGIAVSGSVTVWDLAGNAASLTSPALRIDKTPPELSATATTPAGLYVAGQWTNQDVTVHFAYNDAVSGLASAPADTTVNWDCQGLPVMGTAADQAGNSSTVTFEGISVDKTAPTIVPRAFTRDGEYTPETWTHEDVTVSFVCADALSGLASWPQDTVLDREWLGDAIMGTCVDRAGNSASATFAGVFIDKTPPTLAFGAPAPAANAFGWNNGDVSIPFVAGDALSGLAATVPAASPLVLTAEGTAVTGVVTVTDVAGNVAVFVSPAANIDRTPPTLGAATTTQPNAAGWYNANVTVRWSATDALSGVDERTLPADTVVTGEGAALTAGPVTVADRAGNASDGLVAGLKIDRTAPTLTIAVPQAGGGMAVGTALSFAASDGLSGVAALSGSLTDGQVTVAVNPGDVLATPGVYVLTVQAADAAGNGTAATRFFAVYDPNGTNATGSGSFRSAPGAYVADPALSGKAIFGFTCKYQKGDQVPSSRWGLQFDLGSLSFRSTGYDWLAIRGARAQFKGSGTLNGSANYAFMATAIDGRLAADGQDRLRLKIWDKATGATVYDSEPGGDDLAVPANPLLNGRVMVKP